MDSKVWTRAEDQAAQGHQTGALKNSVGDGFDVQLYLLQAIYVFIGAWKSLSLALGTQLLLVKATYLFQNVQRKAG